MGMSFTTAHIYNAQNLTKAQFKKAFTDMMKAKGYTASDEENAVLTYTLAFSPDRKWVTVLTDGDNTRREAAELAKGLKARAVLIDLVDSDFAELSLFDEAGTHKDTLTLGDSYLEDAAPMGDPAAWQPLLRGSWEQVQEIQNGSYTFAEDALAQFAPLIGMDSGNILLDNDSAVNDNNAVVLHFKKAAEKKLTLKNAFFNIYGEALAPLGYKKAKSKIPCLIRLVNDDILHIVALDSIDPCCFRIKVGIATIYRSKITLDCSMKLNTNWLFTLSDTYQRIMKKKCDTNIWESFLNFSFHDQETMIIVLERSLDAFKEHILPIFNKVNSLSEVIDYLYIVNYNGIRVYGPDVDFYENMTCNDGLLVFILNDPDEYARRIKNIQIRIAKDEGYYNEQTQTEIEESFQNNHNYIQSILSNEKMYKETMDRIEIRKNRNIDILKSIKIIGGKEK